MLTEYDLILHLKNLDSSTKNYQIPVEQFCKIQLTTFDQGISDIYTVGRYRFIIKTENGKYRQSYGNCRTESTRIEQKSNITITNACSVV
jgi:hypothetical protein